MDRHVEGVVEMVLDATGRGDAALTEARLFGWHAALFPTGYSGLSPIRVGAWRDDANGPMQVVSGPLHRQRVHFEAPPAAQLPAEIARFLARADGSPQRFYSLSAQIQRERKDYYAILEHTQKATLDVTAWLEWFLETLLRAVDSAQHTLDAVLMKAHFWQRRAGTPLNERQSKLLNRLLDGFEGKLTSSKWAAAVRTPCTQSRADR